MKKTVFSFQFSVSSKTQNDASVCSSLKTANYKASGSLARGKLKTARGFTIIETLVAIAVLMLALVGPFYAVQSALTSAYVARDQLIASSLAQEGIEYIRGIRDNNFLNNRTWLHGIDAAQGPPGYSCFGVAPSYVCTVDPTRNDIHINSDALAQYLSSNIAAVPVLKVSATNLYNQQPTSGTNINSRFKRYLQIHTISPTEIRVTVTVSWTTARIPYSVVLTGYVQDWL